RTVGFLSNARALVSPRCGCGQEEGSHERFRELVYFRLRNGCLNRRNWHLVVESPLSSCKFLHGTLSERTALVESGWFEDNSDKSASRVEGVGLSAVGVGIRFRLAAHVTM